MTGLNVKIADFALSNEIKDGDLSRRVAGVQIMLLRRSHAAGYTAPEIDVWTCGVISYVMLCGRILFEDDDVQMLFTKMSRT